MAGFRRDGHNLYLYCTLTIRALVYKGMHKQTMFHSIFHSRGASQSQGGQMLPPAPLKRNPVQYLSNGT